MKGKGVKRKLGAVDVKASSTSKSRMAGDSDEENPNEKSAGTTVGMLTAPIRNKLVRGEAYAQLKKEKKKLKREARQKRQKEADKAEEEGVEPPPKQIPRTLENTREKDETMVQPDDEEVAADEATDEFAAHFNCERPPNVLLTTCYKPSKVMFKFLSELLLTFPSAQYYKRSNYQLKQIVKFADSRGFSDVVVINENRKKVNGLLVTHLPDGPTAHFRLSNLKLSEDIPNCGRATSHKPELILNNFNTRLGHRVGRMFASLFCQDPTFRGRRAVTFHNQRDFVFFRHHRYIFHEKEERQVTKAGPGKKPKIEKRTVVKARLQELGPRFTLRLQSLQKGTFDSKHGEFEWVHKSDMDTTRRRFHL
mmetsp:Transcript_6379/g.17852  ORF Transcript_6379/g.17852 Transcript_6379/m.17852 type:complete len:365 (-) Transcript_6379:419-1513(-)|eukprot:CAMPEP_0117664670 /NCGR_PEP_ID=MMETSP0804-20121206/9358_1 /TAXON_ID=1074897 /ORGANISM="Tetraselmis astigmatica, Strain CCMP880" /LENGTH=364 /DNA_ID=CAMNT_0005471947 /DNA_START=222 /DNA_END=1316 /DNA_ORIENTATION=+